MVIGTLRILPLPDRRRDVLEILTCVQRPVLAQPGCTACDIYEETGADRAIVLVDRWESRQALEAHLRSDVYRRVIEAVELSGGAPEVRFDEVRRSEGIELIERSRRQVASQALDKGDVS